MSTIFLTVNAVLIVGIQPILQINGTKQKNIYFRKCGKEGHFSVFK